MTAPRSIQLTRLLAVRAILHTTSGVTVGDVARRLGVAKATAERYLREFEAAHLAHCEPDPAHKQRQVWRAA